MTASTCYHRNNISLMFMILLIFIALIFMAPIMLQQIATAPPIYHPHAVVNHGLEAITVRNCQQQGPVLQIWEKSNGSGRYHCLFQMPDGRIGDQLVQLDSKGFWHEITSFPRYETTIEDVARSLQREAVRVFPK